MSKTDQFDLQVQYSRSTKEFFHFAVWKHGSFYIRMIGAFDKSLFNPWQVGAASIVPEISPQMVRLPMAVEGISNRS
jgi:hypothetical protein